MARILVISGDTLPYPGFSTSGAGLRAWGLGKGLESKGHDVLLAMPRMSVPPGKRIPEPLQDLLYVHQKLTAFITHHQPDILILQHWLLASHLEHSLDIPVVIDFHGPLLMETLFQGNPGLDALKHKKIQALRRADFFTCAGERQRYYFEAWLLMAGFDIRDTVIRTIPVSLSPDLPEHTSQGECTFVYGGMFLPWQDPGFGLTTLTDCLKAKRKGIFKLWGGKHPVLNFSAPKFEQLTARLERCPRTQINPIISRDQLIREYLRSHVAIDVMERNSERELAFTTRTVEYLWCGLPVIYNSYAELAEYIRTYEAGWLVEPGDTQALHAICEEILDHPEIVSERSRNAQRLVREHLTWDTVIEPLDTFCCHPLKYDNVESCLAFNPQSLTSRTLLLQDKFLFHLKQKSLWALCKQRWNRLANSL